MNAYESAISTKQALEEEIMNLHTNLDARIHEMTKEYRDRENSFIWKMKEVQEAYD